MWTNNIDLKSHSQYQHFDLRVTTSNSKLVKESSGWQSFPKLLIKFQWHVYMPDLIFNSYPSWTKRLHGPSLWTFRKRLAPHSFLRKDEVSSPEHENGSLSSSRLIWSCNLEGPFTVQFCRRKNLKIKGKSSSPYPLSFLLGPSLVHELWGAQSHRCNLANKWLRETLTKNVPGNAIVPGWTQVSPRSSPIRKLKVQILYKQEIFNLFEHSLNLGIH